MPNFAGISSPLSKRLKPTKAKILGPFSQKELKALEVLKENLISSAVLTVPKRQLQLTLDKKVCDRQIRCVLLQKQEDGKDRPVGYWKSTLSKPEKKLDTTHQKRVDILSCSSPPILPWRDAVYFKESIIKQWVGFSTLLLQRASPPDGSYDLKNLTLESFVAPVSKIKLRTRYCDFQQTEQMIRISMTKSQCWPYNKTVVERNINDTLAANSCEDKTVTTEPHIMRTAKADEVELPTIAEDLLAKSKVTFCNQMIQLAATLNCISAFGKNWLFMRQNSLDGSIQKLVQINLRPIIL